MLSKELCKQCNTEADEKTKTDMFNQIYHWLTCNSDNPNTIPTSFDLTDIPEHPNIIVCLKCHVILMEDLLPPDCKYKTEQIIMSNEKLEDKKTQLTSNQIENYIKAIEGNLTTK